MINSNLSKARYPIAAALSLMLSSAAFAGGAPAGNNGAGASGPQGPQPVEWGGLGWGLGLAANFDVTGARVGSATVVNNIVRITDSSSNVNLGFVLEAHYFLRDYIFGNGFTPLMVCPKNGFCVELAYGPFVAIEVGGGTSATPSATGAPTAYALGMMVGLRHQDAPPNQSWNFGVGLRVDPKAQVLGDGIVANQLLPVGESTTVRLKTEPRVGVMLLSSFSF